jgi:hypothetical protein
MFFEWEKLALQTVIFIFTVLITHPPLLTVGVVPAVFITPGDYFVGRYSCLRK